MPGFGFKTREQAQRVARAVRAIKGQSAGTEPLPKVRRLVSPQASCGAAKLTQSITHDGSAEALVQKFVDGALEDASDTPITIIDAGFLASGDTLPSGSIVLWRKIPGGYLLDGWKCEDVT